MKKNIIALSAIFFFILIIILISYNLSKNTEDEILNEYQNQQEFIANHIAFDMHNYFASLTEIVRSNYRLTRNIPQNNNANFFVDSNFEKLNSSYVEAVALYDKRGNLNGSTNYELASGNLPGEIFQFLLKNDTEYVSSIKKIAKANSKDSSFEYINFYIPLYQNIGTNKAKNLDGIVLLVINASDLFSPKNILNNPLVKGDEYWIVDKEGNLLFHSHHPEMNLRNINRFSLKCKKCHSDFDYVQSILTQKNGTVVYSLKDKIQKAASFSTLSYGNISWSIVVEAPSRQITSFIHITWIKTVLLIFLIIALISILFIYIFKAYKIKVKAAEELKHWRKEKDLFDKILESEKIYKELFENNPVPMWIYDLNTLKFLMVNSVAVKQFGYSKEEFFSMTLKDIMPAEDIPKLEENLALPESEIEISNTWRHIKKDGTIINVEIVSHSLPERDGFRSRLVMAKDVTDRYRLNKELKESEERYRALFEISPDSIFVHRDNRIIFANPSGIKMLGANSFEDLSGYKVMDFVHPDYREIVKERIKYVQQESKPVEVLNEKFIRIDGSIIDVEVSSAQLIIEGKIAHLIITRDITERIKIEKELLEDQYLLSEAQRITKLGVWNNDFITHKVYWSDQTFSIFGVSKDIETPSLDLLFSIIHPDDKPLMKRWMEVVAAGEKHGEVDFRIILPEGLTQK